MVTVKLWSDNQGLYTRFTLSGHADKRKTDDEYDLVCAAVSAIALTTVTGLADVLSIPGSFESSDGYLSVDISQYRSNETQLLIETMVAGLKKIQEQYPDTLRINK